MTLATRFTGPTAVLIRNVTPLHRPQTCMSTTSLVPTFPPNTLLCRHSLHSGPNPSRSQPLRALFIGSPGSGKGTLSSMLVREHPAVLTLSAGDMLRSHIRQGTDVGKRADQVIQQGKLMPDEVMMDVVGSEMSAIGDRPFFLDGFPRTVGQARLLDARLKSQGKPLNLVVNLDVPPQVILDRILGRWVHPASGRVYNTSYNPPKVAGRDDVTGEPLEQRPDDDPETFKKRLDSFHATTRPLLDHYREASDEVQRRQGGETGHGLFVSLYGTTSKEIWPKLLEAIRERELGLE